MKTNTDTDSGLGIRNGIDNHSGTNNTQTEIVKPKGWTPEKRARLGRKSPHPEIAIVARREGMSRSHVWSVFHGKRSSSYVNQKLAEVRAELAARGPV